MDTFCRPVNYANDFSCKLRVPILLQSSPGFRGTEPGWIAVFLGWRKQALDRAQMSMNQDDLSALSQPFRFAMTVGNEWNTLDGSFYAGFLMGFPGGSGGMGFAIIYPAFWERPMTVLGANQKKLWLTAAQSVADGCHMNANAIRG